MIDRQLAIQLFEKTNSFTKVGLLLGVSKQRIHQFLKGKVVKRPPPPKPPKPISKIDITCPLCNKHFIGNISRKKMGLFCKPCYRKHLYQVSPEYRQKHYVEQMRSRAKHLDKYRKHQHDYYLKNQEYFLNYRHRYNLRRKLLKESIEKALENLEKSGIVKGSTPKGCD